MTSYLILRDWINIEKLDSRFLSLNPNAIELLTQNQDKIDWNNLSLNENAIELLTQNKDKINWRFLSENPNAIELLKDNQDKIDWVRLSLNPSIFTYDYKKIKDDFKQLREEILAKVRHPDRIFKLMKKNDINEVYNTYF